MNLTNIGLTATFECELSKEGLKVEWFKGDKKIRADDKVTLTTDGKVQRLTIQKADADDVAEYSVVLQKLRSAAKLTVQGTH